MSNRQIQSLAQSGTGGSPTTPGGVGGGRDRRNSTSSNSSSSPFLSNSFKTAGKTQPTEIQMQDMKSLSSRDSGEFEVPPPKLDFFDKLYLWLTNRDNFVGESRKIYINSQEQNKAYKYTSNYVKTAKYSIITFLPLNLYEQFCRLANFYFLIISALQLIPGVSPTGRFTTLGPLLVVLAITALKEAWEDFNRHRQDDKVNFSKTQALRNGQFTEVIWKDVQVGDIVKVTNRQYIPSDLLVISSSEPNNICYIETANLDGETNLKMKQSLEETGYLSDNVDNLGQLNGYVECEHPNNRLYNFVGSLYLDGKGYPLSIRQLLLRGAMLRNTKWVCGLVLYTGRDSRLVRNSSPTPLKRSGVEKMTNQFIIIIFFLQILLCASCAIANGFWANENQNSKQMPDPNDPSQTITVPENWYLAFNREPVEEGALSFLTFLILFNNLIPISLYVSMEFVKVFQAYFINNDQEMYYKENDTPALARTSNLNEELGQVEYVFSDKTGTLTQNKMEFKRCTIAGVIYGQGGMTEATMGRLLREGKMSTNDMHLSQPQSPEERPSLVQSPSFYDQKLMVGLSKDHPNVSDKHATLIRDFFSVLAVCHTVIPEIEEGRIVYQASSPDEAALVNAAKSVGFEFTSRNIKQLVVTVRGQEMTYEVLNILEFNSTRKRMSVIVRHPDGRLMLYCKGADTVIFERLGKNQTYGDITITHLQEFATEGLRTLCIAQCEIDPIFYEQWNKEFYTASNSIVDRDNELARVAELIEKNLNLLGATAIEDKLQEGVPDTIRILRQAGIKIWVLTGDKQETAINIGFSAQLLTQQMEMIVVNEESRENTAIELNRRLDEINNPDTDMDIDNMALIIDGNTLLFALEDQSRILLLQLAQLCRVVICCRVSPLQKAEMVLLVRTNLDAVTLAIGDGANDVSMIQAAHVGVVPLPAASVACAWTLFVPSYLQAHLLQLLQKHYTLHYAVLVHHYEWVVRSDILRTVHSDRLQCRMDVVPRHHPRYPRQGRARGTGRAALAAVPDGLPYGDGRSVDLFTVGTVAYSCIVITVNLKLALEVRYWTWLNHAFTWGSIVLYFIWLLVFGKFWEMNSFDVGSDLYDIIYRAGQSALFYFTLIMVPIICLFRDFSWKYITRDIRPHSYHVVQEIARKEKRLHKKPKGSDSHPAGYTGYSFSQDAGQSDAISKRYSNPQQPPTSSPSSPSQGASTTNNVNSYKNDKKISSSSSMSSLFTTSRGYVYMISIVLIIAIISSITTYNNNNNNNVVGVHAYSILPSIELINSILVSPSSTLDASSLAIIQPPQCRIRIINTIISEDSNNNNNNNGPLLVDVIFNSSKKIEALSYLSLTDYITVPTGPISIELVQHSDKRPLNLVGKSIYRLENDTDYTLVLSGVQVEHHNTRMEEGSSTQQQQQQQKVDDKKEKERVSVSILSDINTDQPSSNPQQPSQHQQPTTSNFSPNRLNLRFVQCVHDLPSSFIDFDVHGGATLLSKIRYLPEDKKGVSSTYISIPSRFYQFNVHEHEKSSVNYLNFDSSVYYQPPQQQPQPAINTQNNHQIKNHHGSQGQLYSNLLMVGSYLANDNSKYSIQIISLPSSESSFTQQQQQSGFVQLDGQKYYTFKKVVSPISQLSNQQQKQNNNNNQANQQQDPSSVQQNPSSTSSPTSTFHFSLAIISFALLFGLSVI
ncbi:P-type ATPase [Cavenderia fasciculata]|uniref:Phospholipid-transporting ATPase n=1 Tax=Cavenderia fasciculata TaxID=261658 RepID=F4Q3J3_CACFS|nr:P-type ATPase [Cavenderia fasciculata]EGG17651.1 P-type ATPase [Cavenderia fasciculata]|eukprot:XP_004356135.1 P-type ATPase [Cavenderia fasciculata]